MFSIALPFRPSRLPALAALVAAACTSAPAVQTTGNFPGETWPTSTPEAEGINGATIDSIVDEIGRGEYGLIDAFLLIRHGNVVADYRWEQNYDSVAALFDTTNYQYNYDSPDWHPYYRDTDLHTLQSVTKSVTSAALGIAIDEGLIESVDVPVMAYLAAYDPDLSDPRRTAMTLHDLLTMRSGISWTTRGGYSNPEHSTFVMELSDHWIDYILSRPMDTVPGERYQYNDGASVLIGKILREATGMRADEWARERLFEPIGIDEFYWKITPDGEVDTEGGLYLTTHDLARIGYLFLRGGEWNGRHIVSREWVEASTSLVVPDVAPDNGRLDPGYGYQWWITDRDGDRATVFAGNGYGGQFLLVVPDFDIVAVFNGWNIHGGNFRSTYRVLQNRILPVTEP